MTVTEALWKGRPVIGGDTGGIRLQILDGKTGYLVDSPAKAGRRIGELLANQNLRDTLGAAGRDHVLKNFLLTRELTDHMQVMLDVR